MCPRSGGASVIQVVTERGPVSVSAAVVVVAAGITEQKPQTYGYGRATES